MSDNVWGNASTDMADWWKTGESAAAKDSENNPQAYASRTYYRLWDLLSPAAKATPEAKQAEAAYGVDTLRAIDLLVGVMMAEASTRSARVIIETDSLVSDSEDELAELVHHIADEIADGNTSGRNPGWTIEQPR